MYFIRSHCANPAAAPQEALWRRQAELQQSAAAQQRRQPRLRQRGELRGCRACAKRTRGGGARRARPLPRQQRTGRPQQDTRGRTR